MTGQSFSNLPGPKKNNEGRLTWPVVGCADCPLKASCTDGQVRTWSLNPDTSHLRRLVAARIQEPGAKDRYNQRIATIEPVFAYLQVAMKYDRASSRRPETICGEVLMKVIAYNLSRLMVAAARPGADLRVFVVQIVFDR